MLIKGPSHRHIDLGKGSLSVNRQIDTGPENFLDFITSAETPDPLQFYVNMSTGDQLYVRPGAGEPVYSHTAVNWLSSFSVPRGSSTGAGHKVEIWGDVHKLEEFKIMGQYLFNTSVANYDWCDPAIFVTLDLRNNYINTPPDISIFNNLEYLAIFNNLLTSNVDLTDKASLTSYLAGDNNITGEIPGISTLSSINTVNLRVNNLTQTDVINMLQDFDALWPAGAGKTLYLDGGGNAPVDGNNASYLSLVAKGALVKINEL